MHGPLVEYVESFRTRGHGQADTEEAAGHHVGFAGTVRDCVRETRRVALAAVTAVKLTVQIRFVHPQRTEEGETLLLELGARRNGSRGSLPLPRELGEL